jgi:hypothetical protein
MTARRELDQRRREVQAALLGRLANRAFTRRTDGVDGIAKRLVAKQVPAAEPDPELEHDDHALVTPSRGSAQRASSGAPESRRYDRDARA